MLAGRKMAMTSRQPDKVSGSDRRTICKLVVHEALLRKWGKLTSHATSPSLQQPKADLWRKKLAPRGSAAIESRDYIFLNR